MGTIEGRVIALDKQSLLAAVDIGWGQAIVMEFNQFHALSEGDWLENLQNGYGSIQCYNSSQQNFLEVTVLSGSVPSDTALFVINSRQNVADAA
ncbi:hypothetical protein [Teredinibacter sp. KSP-S5-2]|uniref:hypothetical protein n=1 Tax=Teredinibacter sp. KSP-S5-2 TaxID=3034506 RepID=UPI00293420F7|nr:hypothetical protein [Teredinibacter sp. KSP-S5-2]WNO07673.1 hypothetical protein P5V12_11795 [Teredinibacter sp. KSP-S5-2]